MASRVVSKCIFAALAVVALGGAKKKPPPPPPPPPAPVVIPYRPYPPDAASPNLVLPVLGADALYESPNRNISPAQVVWNLRSGYNVAALNCPEPQRGEITTNYKAFLKVHAKGLAAANRAVDAEFRGKYGARFVASREKYMTNVYNHFALPPTIAAFCNATLAMSRDGKIVKPGALTPFAARSLPSLEIVFDDFYKRYATYKSDLAEWDAKWLALYTQRYGPPKW